jgi:hypothetical protein
MGFAVQAHMHFAAVVSCSASVSTWCRRAKVMVQFRTVDNKSLTIVLAGMRECAFNILSHPERYWLKYPSVVRYSDSGNGKSLTVPELLNLAKSLESESVKCNPDTVGGKVETATLENGAISSLDNEVPPGNDIDQGKEAPRFGMLIDMAFKTEGPIPSPFPVPVFPHMGTLVIGGTFENVIVKLDDKVVTGASFSKCIFVYGGSPLAVFDGTNNIVDSTLQLDKGVNPESPFVVELRNTFPGLKIVPVPQS